MLDDRLEQRFHRGVRLMNLPHRVPLLRARIDNRKIELFIGGIELDEKVKHHVQNLVRTSIFPVDLINNDDRARVVL